MKKYEFSIEERQRRSERARLRNTKHGMRKTPEYYTWSMMLDRCRNSRSHAFCNYGGRGISVCERWHTFENFYADMGPRPEGCSLDRIDNDGNYEPENVRWVASKAQARNRRTNVVVTVGGESISLIEAAEKAGIPYAVVKSRLAMGWALDRALSQPARQLRRRGSS